MNRDAQMEAQLTLELPVPERLVRVPSGLPLCAVAAAKDQV
jgi:hypothetical protein